MRYFVTWLLFSLFGFAYAVDPVPEPTFMSTVTEVGTTLLDDGGASITLVSMVIISIVSLLVLYKWAKAAFWT